MPKYLVEMSETLAGVMKNSGQITIISLNEESDEYTVSEVRKAFKEIGYKFRTKAYSSFTKGMVVDLDGNVINDGNVFSKEYLEKHKKAFDLIASFKGKVFDGMTRVVL